MSKKGIKINIIHLIRQLLLIGFALIVLFPIAYVISGSLKGNQELLSSGTFLPQKLDFTNYQRVWTLVDFSRNTLNSVIISTAVAVGTVILTSMTAYVLDRKKNLKGKKIISAMYVSAIFISIPVATIYPIFKIIINLHLNNTLLGLITVLVSTDIASIFLIQGYLRNIPKEVDESAYIDGCGFFGVYIHIVLPLIKPILATVALLSFRNSWNSYLMPMILTMGRKELMPLTVAIVQMKSSGEAATEWSLMLAGAAISLVPMIVVYIFANKHFVAGVTDGAIKG